MNFVCRLMEQHGIYYFFKHEGGKHTLVLANSQSSHSPINGLATIPYIPLAGADRRGEQHIYEWVSERRFRTGKIELNDYNYQKPNAQMISDAKGSEHYTRSEMEFYDYPGKFKEKSDGERNAKIQLQAEQAMDRRRRGNGDAVNLFPGGLTKLEKHSKRIAERRIPRGASCSTRSRSILLAPAVRATQGKRLFRQLRVLA